VNVRPAKNRTAMTRTTLLDSKYRYGSLPKRPLLLGLTCS
jgi:hypothetical protein